MYTFCRRGPSSETPAPTFLLFFTAFSHAHIYSTQTKDSPSLSHWSGKGSQRSDSLSQTLRLSSVSLYLTPCQHEVTRRQDIALLLLLLRPALALVPTVIPNWSSRRGMLSMSWDERRSRGLQDDNGRGQEAKETGRCTRWPEFLSCLIRDILDLFLLPATDLHWQRSLLKVTPSACPYWLTYIYEYKNNTCRLSRFTRTAGENDKKHAFMHIKT